MMVTKSPCRRGSQPKCAHLSKHGGAMFRAVVLAIAMLALLWPPVVSSQPTDSPPSPAANGPSQRIYYLPGVFDPSLAAEFGGDGHVHAYYLPCIDTRHILAMAPVKRPSSELAASEPPVKGAPCAKPVQGKEPLCRHLVTRVGDQLFLEGKPFTFVGTNVSYLMEDYFPEEEVGKIIAYLAESGVTAIRIWLFPQHSLDRAARLFDLGKEYNMRFVVTFVNYYYDKGAWWFDQTHYSKKYLPHVRRVVSRFRDRPEILMWELMNEPNCSTDTVGSCPDNMVRWAKAVSEEIKALDPCRPITTGTMRIDPTEEHYRRLHALPTIDVVSIHKSANHWPADEIRIARELNKPVLIGEVYARAFDKRCQRLHDGVTTERARIIASDLTQAWAEGIDGYLLWQYAHGRVVVGDQVSYYCGVYDYPPDDPVWKVLKAAPVTRLSIPQQSTVPDDSGEANE